MRLSLVLKAWYSRSGRGGSPASGRDDLRPGRGRPVERVNARGEAMREDALDDTRAGPQAGPGSARLQGVTDRWRDATDNAGMHDTTPFAAHRVRAFIADTTALIVFFTATGVLNERFVSGMSWDEILHARLLGAALMIPVARPYGLWRDRLMRHAGPSRASQLFWDSLALVSFQVPIYAAIIAVSGASGAGLVRGVLGATVLMLITGRPYGAFLNWVRARFGLPPGGERPMSLGD